MSHITILIVKLKFRFAYDKCVVYMHACDVASYHAIDALHTCVFPPVTSCMTDLDKDADEMEHEKNAPMPFIKPKARNSCTIICIANACIYIIIYTYHNCIDMYILCIHCTQ